MKSILVALLLAISMAVSSPLLGEGTQKTDLGDTRLNYSIQDEKKELDDSSTAKEPATEDQEQNIEKPMERHTFYLALLLRGPKWSPVQSVELERLQGERVAQINRLIDSGRGIIAGPIEDEGNIRGVWVLDARSMGEAKKITGSGPLVQALRLAVELHPWYAPADILKPARRGGKWVTYYFGLIFIENFGSGSL